MKAFICGFGTIGQSVARVIKEKQEFFKERYGEPLIIVGALDSRSFVTDPEGLDADVLLESKKTKGTVGDKVYREIKDALDSIDFDILIEVTSTDINTGGVGLDNIKYALKHDKDVVTANKGPLALRYKELMNLADEHNRYLLFEGTVGGAMPIINLNKYDLAGQKIKSIRGIFNGTCNYILTKMDSGQPFEQALKEAQQQGYAETDPTNDVEGYDSACKVVILANSIFGRNVTFKDVDITGITTINSDAIALAKSNDMVIRLIGEVSANKLEVAPRLIPRGHPLSLPGTLNTAEIITEYAGPITVSGIGAGGIETASAILSDLIDIMDERIGD
ncbi:MAG: homoserine dehydrogenase [Candidatus Methanomethylophilaceae archaeon]|nr:homoserine dehydrogenase [Candidatus Methanomethylophilaceae archaeon]